MSKFMTESGWKATTQKFKVADNGLQKALAAYEKLAEDKHSERLKALASISALAGKLKVLLLEGIKTAKEHKAKPEVIKNLTAVIEYLADVLKAADTEQKQVDAAEAKVAADAKAPEPPMLDRLVNVAQTISGEPGSRLRKAMTIAQKLGGSWKTLWFYNYEAVGHFVQFHTTQEDRRDMTKATNGKLPFKGDSGYGPWVIYPFLDSLNNSCRKGCADKALADFLIWMDGQIQYSMNKMSQVQNAGNLGGGSGFGPSVDEFLKHVGSLSKNTSHLYSAGY